MGTLHTTPVGPRCHVELGSCWRLATTCHGGEWSTRSVDWFPEVRTASRSCCSPRAWRALEGVCEPLGTGGSAGILDLHERQTDVGEGVAHGGGIVAEPFAEPLDQAGNGVDGESGLA